MARIDEVFRKPNPIADLESPRAAADIDDNFDAIWLALQKLKDEVNNLETGGSDPDPNDLLDGDQHQDTDAGDPEEGDLIRGSSDATPLWERFAKGTAGQFLRMVTDTFAWVTVTTTDFLHNLLSATHSDTTAASPVLGDLIVADRDVTGLLDDSLTWLDGQPLNAISGENDPSGVKFWIDGAPMDSIIAGATVGATTWRRKAVGAVGTALVVQPDGVPGWQSVAGISAAVGARVYRSTNFTLTWGTPTAITFDTSVRDDAGFWTVGSPTRLTVSSAGWYLVTGQVAANYAQFGLLQLSVYVNGAVNASAQLGMDNVSSGWGVDYETKQVAALVYLSVGQYVELFCAAARTSGANAAMIGGAHLCHLSIFKLG